MQARIVEGDSRLRGDPLGELPRFEIEPAPGWIQEELGVGLRRLAREVENQGLGAPPAGLAEPAHLGPVVQHLGTSRTSRFRHHLEDQRHECAGVVGRGERVANERDRLPGVLRCGVRATTLMAQVRHRRARFIGANRPEDRDQQSEREQRNEGPESDQEHVRCSIGPAAVMRSGRRVLDFVHHDGNAPT